MEMTKDYFSKRNEAIDLIFKMADDRRLCSISIHGAI